MTCRVVRADRHEITVRLNGGHASDGPSQIVLPTSYVGAHVDYGYARTVDTAQGATVDHSLLTPSAATSAERAYVALSRGRETNRIYATTDRSWIDAIGDPRGHTFATDQNPDLETAGHRERSARLDDDQLDHRAARKAALRAALTGHGNHRRPRTERARHLDGRQPDHPRERANQRRARDLPDTNRPERTPDGPIGLSL
jgi:hypothetical protein